MLESCNTKSHNLTNCKLFISELSALKIILRQKDQIYIPRENNSFNESITNMFA